MKRLLYHLGIIDLVWVEYHDKAMVRRTVWHYGDKRYIYGIAFDVPVEMLPEGKLERVEGKSYLEHWYPYNFKPKDKPCSHQWLNPFGLGKSKAKDVMWRLQGHKLSK